MSLGILYAQQDQPLTSSSTKRILAEGGDHFDLMSPMGRLAQRVAKARTKRVNLGNGTDFRVSAADPDHCLVGDEDCSEEGFQDGPNSTQSEMSLAIDPSGLHIVVAFNDFRGLNRNPLSISGFAYSDD